MDNIPVANVKLDRLSLICNIEDPEHFSALLQFMGDAKENKNKPGYTYKGEKYYKRCTFPLHHGDKHYKEKLYVQCGVSHDKLYAKFSFNPGKMDQDAWHWLYTYFSMVFDSGYNSFYEICRIDRLEVAVDISNVSMFDTHVIDYALRSYNLNYFNKGLYYLGAQHSKRNLAIYDKKNELLKHQGITIPEEQLLRIETRLNPQNLLLKDIGIIVNPLLTIRVIKLANQEHLKQSVLWKSFSEEVIKSPIAQTAYLNLTGHQRSSLQLRINQLNVNWWNPQKLWAEALELFPVLIPPAQPH